MLAKPTIAVRSPAVEAEAKYQVTMPAFDEIRGNVVLLVQQQRLREAIALWQRVVDSYSASASETATSADASRFIKKEHAIALRGRAMLHRLNGDADAALTDLALACSLDAREKLAKLPARSSLTQQLRWNVLQALQSPELIGAQPKAPLAAAMQYQREAESYDSGKQTKKSKCF